MLRRCKTLLGPPMEGGRPLEGEDMISAKRAKTSAKNAQK